MSRVMLAILAPLALLAVATAAFSACTSSSDGNRDAGLQIAALSFIDTAGFHGIDANLNGSGPKVESAWLGRVRKAQVSAASVPWPKELQPKARTFIEASTKLLDALDKDDAKAAAAPAKAAHEAQHELSNGAWDALGRSAGTHSGSDGHKD